MVFKFLVGLIGLIIALMLYVRLAPTDVTQWHVTPPDTPGKMAGGAVMILPGDHELLVNLAQIAESTKRTQLLAGRLEDGLLTYITRSRIWGFPDYTTIALSGDGHITLYARLRFGRSDLGVNKARLVGWLRQLKITPAGN